MNLNGLMGYEIVGKLTNFLTRGEKILIQKHLE